MKNWKKLVAIAVATMALVGLTSCQDLAKDATVYVQGELDAVYLGKVNQEYLDVVEGMTEEDAKEKYEHNLEAEAQILLQYLGVEMPTDEVNQRAQNVVAEIYSHAKYTVADAEKLKSGDIASEVTVSPIEILHLITQDTADEVLTNVVEQAGLSNEQLANLSDADYQKLDEMYAMGLLDKLESLMPQLSYGTDQVVMLQMKKDDNGYYSLMESGIQKVDEVMIDYSGTYQ